MMKANGKVWLYLDSARLNKVIIRPGWREADLNDILRRLAGIIYITMIDARSGYHDQKLDCQSAYLRFLVHLASTGTYD